MEKVCRTCGRKKNISQFHNNRYNPDGKAHYCKICINEKVKESKKKTDTSLPKLTNVKPIHYYQMYKALEKLGYDLSRPIHEQFCERHNLKPKNAWKGRDIRYTWDDVKHLGTI